MKKIIILAVAFLIASPAVFGQMKAGKKDTTLHTALFTCPIHFNAINYIPGKCRFCGMDLNLTQKQELKSQISKTNTCPIDGGIVTNIAGRSLNMSLKEKMKMEIMKLNIYTANVNMVDNKLAPNCCADMVAKKIKWNKDLK